MRPRKVKPNLERRAAIIAEALGNQASREVSYRGQALKLFPHVCGRCRREFTGAGLSELTVHHKDNNHSNNPPDGSNWELLCVYCHDDEHQDTQKGGYVQSNEVYSAGDADDAEDSPFAGLMGLLPPEKKKE